MPTLCVIAGCSSTLSVGVSLHRFPKDETLQQIWATKLRLARATWFGPSPTSVICSDHFTAEDFETSLHGEFEMAKAPYSRKLRFRRKSFKRQAKATKRCFVKTWEQTTGSQIRHVRSTCTCMYCVRRHVGSRTSLTINIRRSSHIIHEKIH